MQLDADALSLSCLVSTIYDAALDSGRWTSVLALVAEAFGGAAIGLLVACPDVHEPPLAFAHGLAPEMATAYLRDYAHLDPWAPHYVHDPSGMTRLVDCPVQIPPEFESGLLRPAGLLAGPNLAACLERFPGGESKGRAGGSGMVIWQAKGCRERTRTDVRLISFLMPHLQRAVAIHRTVAVSQTLGRNCMSVFECLDTGVVLLDSRGRVVWNNAAAQTILDEQDGLVIRQSRIGCLASRAHHQLQQEISACYSWSAATVGRSFVAVPRKHGRRDYSVTVMPMDEASGHATIDQPAGVVLFVRDPECMGAVSRQLLEAQFGLTPAQARVAELVASGYSPREASQMLSTSESTIRSHLKAIYAKTDTRGSPELVRLIHLVDPRLMRPGKAD